MLDYEFTVAQTREAVWVLSVCPPFGEPIALGGAFRTRQAALAAIARNRARWMENDASHGFRVIDGTSSDGSVTRDVAPLRCAT
jgi:hypothetical protein